MDEPSWCKILIISLYTYKFNKIKILDAENTVATNPVRL